jgi:hypothetical protein
MPHASEAGVRLLLDASMNVGKGFSGGFGGGAQVGYAF